MINRRVNFLLLLTFFCSLFAGCQSIPQNEGAPASVTDVVSKLKRDIGKYQQYDAWASKQPAQNDECEAVVGFAIDSVKIALTTATDRTTSGTAEATLPVSTTTIGAKLGIAEQVKGTETMTFSVYPLAPDPMSVEAEPAINPAEEPIAASLQQLRKGLLQAGNIKPCMSLIPIDPEAKDPGNTFTFGFAVINTATVGGSIKFVIFSLGASDVTQRQASNSITVAFKARPGSHSMFYMNQ